MKYLNLGCGTHYNSCWINIDSSSKDPSIIIHDISKGIPFVDNYFDVVYHSHLLEHLHQYDAQRLLNDCFRVLKPKGTIRVAVPDLEVLTRIYLKSLDRANIDFPETFIHYDWIMLELYDQSVRIESGGEILRYIINSNPTSHDFIRSRIGLEFDQLLDITFNKTSQSIWSKIHTLNSKKIIKFFRIKAAMLLIRLLLGSQGYSALREGLFRQSGEVHRWMYDRFSLNRLLKNSGFCSINVCSAFESKIHSFSEFQLDVVDGVIRKPDSLFMEATKP
jgi:SAM-dependent methyltransferase